LSRKKKYEMHPKQVQIENYHYDLHDSKIAKYPLEERDSSKLLVYNKGKITEGIYKNVDQYIPNNDLLIFNNTKIIQARLHFNTSKGSKIEILCIEPVLENVEQLATMQHEKEAHWLCLIKGASKWKEKTIQLEINNVQLKAEN